MTLDKAIETLKKMYEAALKMPFVFDPLAWALRGTWKLYLALPDSTISMFQVQDAPDANAGDTVSKKAVELALLEKGQSSERYKIGEIWELNFDEIREALAIVPPAQPEQRWIPFVLRPATDEEKEENPDLDYYLDGKLPDDGQKILITVRLPGHEGVQADEFCKDADGSYLDGGYEIGTEAVAWMPMPAPYKEKQK